MLLFCSNVWVNATATCSPCGRWTLQPTCKQCGNYPWLMQQLAITSKNLCHFFRWHKIRYCRAEQHGSTKDLTRFSLVQQARICAIFSDGTTLESAANCDFLLDICVTMGLMHWKSFSNTMIKYHSFMSNEICLHTYNF